MDLLAVENLRKTFKDQVAVADISFQIKQGSCFGLLGPNGAGKTTTIVMMEGILPPSSGQVLYRGKTPGKDFRQNIGIQFQSTSLPDRLNCLELLDLFGSFYPKNRPIKELIELCDLAEFLDREPKRLSGGQKQRLLLALALINDPELVFLDEPTTGLDPQARRNFWNLVQKILGEGKTVVLTTHYMDEAELLCDHLVIIDHGKIIEQGSPKFLLNQHFPERMIRLPLSQREALQALQLPLLQAGDRLELASSNLEQDFARLIQQGVSLEDVQVHSANLEDLFIKLTGHQLRA